MAIDELVKEIRSAKRVYLCGNGGSAANALHIANDLVSVGVRAQALTGDVATLTAAANDFGYHQAFARQIGILGEAGDLLVVLSGSGNSANILQALKTAKALGIKTWAVLGDFGTPKAAESADKTLFAGKTMQEAEEEQIRIGHELMRRVREAA